jgi:hypothetical protein
MAIRLKDLVAGQERLAQQEEQPIRINREQFARLVDVLSNKAQAKDNVNQVVQPRIFEEFVRQTQRREELLKDATDDQKVIFDKLSDSINKLKDANKSDSVALRRVIDQLTRKLGRTADTGARKTMMAALPTPTTRTVTPASRLTSGPYTPFEGSASIGVNEDTGESPMLSDFLKNLMQGNNNGDNAESISRNVKDLLGEGFEDYLQYRMMKDALKRTPKGGPVVVDGPGKTPKKYTPVPTQPTGPNIKRPPRPVPKPPSTLKRFLTTIKNSKIAPGRLGLVGAGLIGLNEYAESGDVSRAVAKGAVQGAGTYAGAAAGAAAGALIGSIGGPLGAGIGAIVGGIGGGILGGSLSEKPADLAADFVSNPVKTTKDAFAKIKAKLEPMAQDTQAKLISDLTGQNQDYMTNANVPNIVIPSINQSTPAKQENNYLLPQAPARNTESTLEKFLNRNYF